MIPVLVLLYTLPKNSGLKRLKLSQAILGCTEVVLRLVGSLVDVGLSASVIAWLLTWLQPGYF